MLSERVKKIEQTNIYWPHPNNLSYKVMSSTELVTKIEIPHQGYIRILIFRNTTQKHLNNTLSILKTNIN